MTEQLVLLVRNESLGQRSIYDGTVELQFPPGETREVTLSSRAAMVVRNHPDLHIYDAVDVWLEQRANDVASAAPTGDMAPLVLMGMQGWGDSIHHRAILREAMKTREVMLATCHASMYHDLAAQGLKLAFKRPHLRTQAKGAARELGMLTAPLPPKAEARTLSYAPVEIARHGSVLGAMFASVGFVMPDKPDFSLPVPDAWRAALRARLPATGGKPIMVLRPIVLRREWSGQSRNPDPAAFDALFRSIADRFFVISIADLEDGIEWLDGPPYQAADLVWHKGELDFPHLAALFAESALVFSPAGFGPILAAAVGTPSVTVFGGYESSRTIRAGRDPAKSFFVDTDHPCSCFSHRHACRKQITLPPVLERLAAFVAPLAAPMGAPAAPRLSIPPQPTKPHPRAAIAGRGAVHRVAIIAGGAANALDELAEARQLCAEAGETPVIVAVNDMTKLIDGEVVMATLHHHRIREWLADRAARGYPAPAEVWSWWRPRDMPGLLSHVTADWQGSSGLFGVAVAIQRGHFRILCAGIPMEPSAGHIVRGTPWEDCNRYRKGWEDNMPQLMGRVRSVSGWTRARLGYPDLEWLVG